MKDADDNRTRREGLIFMAIAMAATVTWGSMAVKDILSVDYAVPWEEVVFNFSLILGMYSFAMVPISLAAYFGWLLWSRPNDGD